jgi:hypothetical protein
LIQCADESTKEAELNFNDLFAMTPVNRTAARVISQRGVTGDEPLSKQDLVQISNRLLRKQRLLRLVLGITKASQDLNFKKKARRGIPTNRGLRNPRAADEYLRICPVTQTIQIELARLNAERKQKARNASAT